MMDFFSSTDTNELDSCTMRPVSIATFLYAISSSSMRSAARTAVSLIIWSTVAMVLR